MERTWDRIKTVAKKNNGFIKTAQVEEIGISRPKWILVSQRTLRKNAFGYGSANGIGG